MKHYLLDEANQIIEVTFDDWATRFSKLPNRVTASTPIFRKPLKKGNPKMLRKINKLRERIMHVSTVFLGIDHGWGTGKPILFETMVFMDNDWGGIYQHRYYTYEDALVGHKETIAKFSKPLTYSKYI